MKPQLGSGGIVALGIVIILAVLGINEAGGLDGVKQDILAFINSVK